MKFLWWRIRYTYWMWHDSVCTLTQSWEAANACGAEDFEIDEYSPHESVGIEMSYWES